MNQLIEKNQKAFAVIEQTTQEMRDLMEAEQVGVGSKCAPEMVDEDKNPLQQIREMRNEFGNLLYTVLCPINGYPLKNRRYADGTHENLGRDTATGPAVHQKIGEVSSWSSKASWSPASHVWNDLKQAHVDLTHNGIKSRKDHKEVMQDFLDTRDAINNLLAPKNAEGKRVDMSFDFTLKDPVELTIIHYKDNDKFLGIMGTWKSKVTQGHVSDGNLSVLVPNMNNDGEDKQAKFHLGRKIDCSFRYADTWKENVFVLGMSDIIAASEAVDAYGKLGAEYKKALDKWEELKDRYAGRMLLKGAF